MKWLFLCSTLPMYIYFILKASKAIQMLQQNYYDEDNRYFKWIIANPHKALLEVDMFFIAFIVFLFLSFNTSAFIFGIFYFITTCLYVKKMNNDQKKKPLALTARVKRLFTMLLVLMLIPTIVMTINFNELYFAYNYLLLGLLTYLTYFVVMTGSRLCIPIEKLVHRHFRVKAIKKLKSMNNLDVVGITGSYGKTSSKNILNDILSIKFDSFKTPKNYNTPIGLILSINNYLDKFSTIFIAEMGAFKVGEIKDCCDLVHPKYGILTKIGTAHLVSFGSQENIQKGKFELIESLPSDGAAVLNGDDPLQLSYTIKSNCKKLWIGIENHDVDLYATNIKLTNKGMTFDCKFRDDDNLYPFETKLLGNANIYNILAGVMLGKHLGMSIQELQRGVKKVQTIEHRLELKKYGDINIIDDAYNSNPVGSKMALDVLNLMPGKKIVVTPGMIELGDQQHELNKKFGEYISEVADEVILVGETQTKPIYEGLAEKGFDNDKIHIINDVKLAFPLMRELKNGETYVLLENDLPDLFNEK